MVVVFPRSGFVAEGDQKRTQYKTRRDEGGDFQLFPRSPSVSVYVCVCVCARTCRALVVTRASFIMSDDINHVVDSSKWRNRYEPDLSRGIRLRW